MRTLVLGAGVSGLAAARLARREGHVVSIHDSGPGPAGGLADEGVSVSAGEWDATLLEGVDLVVTSPGIPERSLPITGTLESGVPLVSEIEFAWRFLRHVPTVAVTGTNGKTTVTSLVSEMLTRSGVDAPPLGNIGEPLSDAVAAPPGVVVVEVSSFQLRFADTFAPSVAVVTNVAPDHLDWHGSFDRYLDAKAAIVARQRPEDLLVHDAADQGAALIARRAPGRVIGIPEAGVSDSGHGIDPSTGELAIGDLRVPIGGLRVSDRPFLVDLVLAGVAAVEAGASPEAVVEICLEFQPGEHRRTPVADIGGVAYVDDSKATNPHAALAAIRSYPSVVLIAGGIDKGLDVAPLATEPNVRAVVAIGTAAPALLAAAGERGVAAASMEEAVRAAEKRAEPGDVVLLAPGCSSFDMFASYSQRGDEFAAAVERMRREEAR